MDKLKHDREQLSELVGKDVQSLMAVFEVRLGWNPVRAAIACLHTALVITWTADESGRGRDVDVLLNYWERCSATIRETIGEVQPRGDDKE